MSPAEADGGPHQMVEPGATWRPRLKVEQPAATLWYHAHPHGQTALQVYAGLAGVILVADEQERALGLPSAYGVDDFPLVLQDKLFEEGRLVYPNRPMVMMQGLRGDTRPGQRDHQFGGRVPAALVRLRLVNGPTRASTTSRSRMGRAFHWIASDGGLLHKPVERARFGLLPASARNSWSIFPTGAPSPCAPAPDPTFGMG